MKEPRTNYDSIAKFFHWFLALNIGATLIFSPGMADLSDDQKGLEYGDHSLSVTLILILMCLRLAWRLYRGVPSLPSSMHDIQKRLANSMHAILYGLIFLQICVGLALANTTTVAFIFAPLSLNYSTLFSIEQKHHDWLLAIHSWGATLLSALIIFHILAAIKHHFIDKDDVLKRMLPFTSSSKSKAQ